MGGFLLVLHDQPVTETDVRKRVRASLQTMEENGLRLKQTVSRTGFTLFLFARRLVDSESVFTSGNDDFIAVTGALFHRRKTGVPAMRSLFDEFSGDPPRFSSVRGQFCVVLFKSGNLHLFTDSNGIYQVFSDKDCTVIGSSFLAVAKAAANRSVRVTELYESIFCGPLQGTRTMIEGVSLLDPRNIHQLRPARRNTPQPPLSPLTNVAHKESHLVEAWSDLLQDYSSMVRDAFGDRTALAMSGGYDTRLLQASVRRAGMNPYTYVYGPDSTPDVRAARLMAAGEKIPLDVINHLAYPLVPPSEFAPVLRSLFLFFDGITTQGAVGSGQELATRLSRSARVLLQLNGGGGESFRNFWRLPDRPVPVRSFVEDILLGHVDYSVCSPVLDRAALVNSMEAKIREVLSLAPHEPLPKCISTLYARLYQHHWVGRNMSNNATLTHALAPLSEPEFTRLGDLIPYKSRRLGRFQASVIQRVSPRMAGYVSAYGFRFDRPASLPRRVTESAMTRVPGPVRRLALRLQARGSGLAPLPPFLQPAYIEGAFGKGKLEIDRYLDIRRIRHRETRNRALTMELLLRELT